MKKRVFYTEFAFVLGLLLLAWGTALTVWGDFGISMVVAPAYMLHLALSARWEWFTFGMAEYIFQACILIIMMLLLRKVKLAYFLSFAATFLYGILLDAGTALIGVVLPSENVAETYRLLAYVVGDFAVCAGVAMMFQTYLPPEAYELFVKELGNRTGIKLHILKTAYDCVSLVIAVCMSFVLLGQLQGIGLGTVICAFLNGTIVKLFTLIYARLWEFRDRFSFRQKLEGKQKESEETI